MHECVDLNSSVQLMKECRTVLISSLPPSLHAPSISLLPSLFHTLSPPISPLLPSLSFFTPCWRRDGEGGKGIPELG